MRTTLRIDDNLLKLAKEYALRHQMSLTALMEEALRLIVLKEGNSRQKIKKKFLSIPTYQGKGLRAKVDLDDSASLLDLMESS